MPSKKRKYNARFPAGRIKKIMQTDEEVGKVAQAVPIIISRTLELFVESLLRKAMEVTLSRNAKTLSPSHVKQCILAESRFDFLRDLVKNIPDVIEDYSAAEEKEMQSAESSPNSSRFAEPPPVQRRVPKDDSNTSSPADVRPTQPKSVPEPKPVTEKHIQTLQEPVPVPPLIPIDANVAIDLSKKEPRLPNFYQETLKDPDTVIRVNPSYSNPQPSTSNYPTMANIATQVKPNELPKIQIAPLSKSLPKVQTLPPLLNIDLTNMTFPEIKILQPAMSPNHKVIAQPKSANSLGDKKIAKPGRPNVDIVKKPESSVQKPVDIDALNSGNLEIDEDYDT